jgi:hypothetical protein
MTISTGTPAKFESVPPAIGPVFNLGFPTFEDSDIEDGVEVEDSLGTITQLVNGVDFTLKYVGIKGQDTEITLTSALNVGDILRVKFSTEVFQGTSFQNLGRFAPVAFETVLDRFAMFMKAIVDNGINVAISSTDVVSVEATDFTADYDKLHIINGATNIQLPSPVINKKVRFKKLASGDVNLLRAGSENIDGIASDLVLDSDLGYIELVTDGADWFIL